MGYEGVGTAMGSQYDYMTDGSGFTMRNETHPTLGEYCGLLCDCVCGVQEHTYLKSEQRSFGS